MALFCEVHAPWDNKSLATIPVTCPSCIIESLTAELDKEHADRDKEIRHYSAKWKDMGSEIESLRARVAELEGDGKRLDWLESNVYVGFNLESDADADLLDWRGAIDRARATLDERGK
jgi:hypothetical protein